MIRAVLVRGPLLLLVALLAGCSGGSGSDRPGDAEPSDAGPATSSYDATFEVAPLAPGAAALEAFGRREVEAAYAALVKLLDAASADQGFILEPAATMRDEALALGDFMTAQARRGWVADVTDFIEDLEIQDRPESTDNVHSIVLLGAFTAPDGRRPQYLGKPMSVPSEGPGMVDRRVVSVKVRPGTARDLLVFTVESASVIRLAYDGATHRAPFDRAGTYSLTADGWKVHRWSVGYSLGALEPEASESD